MADVRNHATLIPTCAAVLVAALATIATPAGAGDCAQTAPAVVSVIAQPPLQARPADCARVEQSPPDFSWPASAPGATYEFRLRYPDGRSRTVLTGRNWLAWPQVLPPGEYQWQIAVLGPRDRRVDAPVRRFVVTATAEPFLIPDWRVVLDHASAMARPRALPPDRDALRAALLAKRDAGLDYLLGSVVDRLGAPLPAPPAPPQPRDALDVAFAWIVTGEARYLEEAERRARHLADWATDGTTSYANADEQAREITWALALLYDWLAPMLGDADRQRLLATLEARVTDIYDDIIVHRRFAAQPFDSHRSRTLTHLAAIAVLLAGDLPAADVWIRDALPLAVHWTNPWGGEDGGFANGTAYALWDISGSLLAWYVLRWAADVDLAGKAWSRNFPAYLVYFLPPGSPAGVFGDGAELPLTEVRARLAKAYARFAPSALARWYAAALAGEDPGRLELLLAPPADPDDAGALPSDTANARHFPSIGWTAMHSSLRDPDRVSIYFKSSPYGSYNHSHADQNSFVLNAGGERLAIDSGYYDEYRSPHWRHWYKQTIAHNAITFDGGRGQPVFEESDERAPGVITHFTHRPDYDIVSADASSAYGGALSRAERTLVYLRPGSVLIHDVLASAQPRRWEWNIHALQRILVDADHSIRLRSGAAQLCIDMLHAPAVNFVQTDEFTSPPQGTRDPQWHGRFVSNNASTDAEFLALLRVDCEPTSVSVSASVESESCGWQVALDDHRVRLCGARSQVEPAPSLNDDLAQ
jgi:hypothetical protein